MPISDSNVYSGRMFVRAANNHSQYETMSRTIAVYRWGKHEILHSSLSFPRGSRTTDN